MTETKGESGRGLMEGGCTAPLKGRLGSSCSLPRNLRRVFSQTQMREKNGEPGLAEMARLQMKGRLRALPFSKFSPKRMEND